MLSMAQYGDLPQIVSMDESQYPAWGAETYSYEQTYIQQDVHFSPEDETYFDDLENGAVSVRPLERFMHDQYSIPQSVLHAKYPVERLQVNRFVSWHSADCYRHVSPDRTSASGSNTTLNELHSPLIFRAGPYGSPTEAFSQPPLPYPTHFKDCEYLPSPPHLGGSVNLRQLEYEHHELESEPTMEDIETVDMKHEAEHVPDKTDTTPSNDARAYPDSAIGTSPRDAEEVVPLDDTPSDSDYTPKPTRPRKRRRSSLSNSTPKRPPPTKRPRRTPKNHTASTAELPPRPFPCPLAPYGCASTFASKNEWKRHVSTQHIKLGFWRCDMCAPTTDPHNTNSVYHNEFNRKDLFMQHLRRMHAPITDVALRQVQMRCWRVLRGAPGRAGCLFCERGFEGGKGWEEWVDHVGRHFERDGGRGVDVREWRRDEGLERYLVEEGIVVREEGEGWRIGDGRGRVGCDGGDGEGEME